MVSGGEEEDFVSGAVEAQAGIARTYFFPTCATFYTKGLLIRTEP